MAPPNYRIDAQGRMAGDSSSTVNTNRLALDANFQPVNVQVGGEQKYKLSDKPSVNQLYIDSAFVKYSYGDSQNSLSLTTGVVPGVYKHTARILGGDVRARNSFFSMQAYGGFKSYDDLGEDGAVEQNWDKNLFLVGATLSAIAPVYFDGVPLIALGGNYEREIPAADVFSYRGAINLGSKFALYSKGHFDPQNDFHQIKAGFHSQLSESLNTDIVYGHSDLPPVFSFNPLDREEAGYLDASITTKYSNSLFGRLSGWKGVQGPQLLAGGDLTIGHKNVLGQAGYQQAGDKSKVLLAANGHIPIGQEFMLNPFATDIYETISETHHVLAGAGFLFNSSGYVKLSAQGGIEKSSQLGLGGFASLNLILGLIASASGVRGTFSPSVEDSTETTLTKNIKKMFRRGRQLLTIKGAILPRIDEFKFGTNSGTGPIDHAMFNFSCVKCHSYPSEQIGDLAKNNFNIIDIPKTDCAPHHREDHGLPSATFTHLSKTVGLMCHQCHGEKPAHGLNDPNLNSDDPLIIGKFLPSAAGKNDGHPDVKLDTHYKILKPENLECASGTCHDAGDKNFSGGVPFYSNADKKIIGTVRNDCNHCHDIHAKGESLHYMATPLSQTDQCTPCHDGKHLEKQGGTLFACTLCHTTADEAKGILGKPETLYHPQDFKSHMQPQPLLSLCFKCHDGEHPNKAGNGTLFGCQSCHTHSNPAPHISFEQHKFTVDEESCQGCHQGDVPSKPNGKYAFVPLCATCHDTHLVGSTYHEPEWRLNHQIEAVRPTAECESCHGNANDTLRREPTQNFFCVSCHQSRFDMQSVSGK